MSNKRRRVERRWAEARARQRRDELVAQGRWCAYHDEPSDPGTHENCAIDAMLASRQGRP